MRNRLNAAARRCLLEVKDGREFGYDPATHDQLVKARCIAWTGAIHEGRFGAYRLYTITKRGRERAADIERGREIRSALYVACKAGLEVTPRMLGAARAFVRVTVPPHRGGRYVGVGWVNEQIARNRGLHCAVTHLPTLGAGGYVLNEESPYRAVDGIRKGAPTMDLEFTALAPPLMGGVIEAQAERLMRDIDAQVFEMLRTTSVAKY